MTVLVFVQLEVVVRRLDFTHIKTTVEVPGGGEDIFDAVDVGRQRQPEPLGHAGFPLSFSDLFREEI